MEAILKRAESINLEYGRKLVKAEDGQWFGQMRNGFVTKMRFREPINALRALDAMVKREEASFKLQTALMLFFAAVRMRQEEFLKDAS